MAAAAQAIKKAASLVAKADKKLTSWTLPWNVEQRNEETAELFVDASGQYKIAKEWDKAGQTYIRAAELYSKCNSEFEACTSYTNAGKAYKNTDTKEATKCFTLACNLHRDANRFSSAGKLFKEIALIEEKECNLKGAIDAYTEAADCFEAENSTVTKNSMRLKVAEISALEQDFKRSIEIYENVAQESLDNRMQAYAVKDYLFKAGLCHLVQCAHSGEMENVKAVEDAMNTYKDMHPAFEGSRECNLLDGCIEAFKNDNCEDFTNLVFKYDKISKLNNWTASLLLEVKNVIKQGISADPSDSKDDPDPLGIM